VFVEWEALESELACWCAVGTGDSEEALAGLVTPVKRLWELWRDWRGCSARPPIAPIIEIMKPLEICSMVFP